MHIGDVMQFGGFEWRVLAAQDSRALIITDRIIEQRSYHNKYVGITWEERSLRDYLNREFYERFSEDEKELFLSLIKILIIPGLARLEGVIRRTRYLYSVWKNWHVTILETAVTCYIIHEKIRDTGMNVRT